MNKPLVYQDSDFAILCLMRSLSTEGLHNKAELLSGLRIADPSSAYHAHAIIAAMPKTIGTRRIQETALELLACATKGIHGSDAPQPIELS